MRASKRLKPGFTIVELLIVIVVIGILAAIVIVAYNGIQTRAADSAVQSDLKSIASKVQMYHATHGDYPNGGGSTTFPGGITHSINRRNYDTDGVNLYYCTVHSGENARFALAAQSISGKIYAYYDGGFQPYGSSTFTASTNICPNVGIPTSEANFEFHYGLTSAGAWSSWTN